MPRHSVDIVVVTYNSRQRLRRCVETLAHVDDFNVVVVDSASSDGTLAAVEDLPLTAVGLTENRGFGHACNVGWRRGDAPFVLFVNPDATIHETAVRALVAATELDSRIAAAAPRIVDERGELDFSMRRFPRLRTTFAQALFLHRILPRADWSDELVRDPAAYERPWRPDWVSGACILAKRPVLEQLAGFDDGFFMYCEDIDLCRRIHDLKLEVRFVPDALVSHEGGASLPRSDLLPVLAESRIRYARKHRSTAAAAAERLGVAIGALTHAVAGRAGTRMGHLRALLVATGLSAARRPKTQTQDATGSA